MMVARRRFSKSIVPFTLICWLSTTRKNFLAYLSIIYLSFFCKTKQNSIKSVTFTKQIRRIPTVVSFLEPLLASKRVWAGLVSWSLAGRVGLQELSCIGALSVVADLCWPLTGAGCEQQVGVEGTILHETL